MRITIQGLIIVVQGISLDILPRGRCVCVCVCVCDPAVTANIVTMSSIGI